MPHPLCVQFCDAIRALDGEKVTAMLELPAIKAGLKVNAPVVGVYWCLDDHATGFSGFGWGFTSTVPAWRHKTFSFGPSDRSHNSWMNAACREFALRCPDSTPLLELFGLLLDRTQDRVELPDSAPCWSILKLLLDARADAAAGRVIPTVSGNVVIPSLVDIVARTVLPSVLRV